jgi:hypothetical protein
LQLVCKTDEQRLQQQRLMIEAFQTRLGLKTLWARDISAPTLQTLLAYNPMVVDRFSNDFSSVRS